MPFATLHVSPSTALGSFPRACFRVVNAKRVGEDDPLTPLSPSLCAVSISFGISASFGSTNQQSALDSTEFTLKLHSRPCAENGGAVYQHPFRCPDGCTQAEVDAEALSAEPLEVVFKTVMNTASANEATLLYDWPVYVPDFYNGDSRYVPYSLCVGVPATHQGCARHLGDIPGWAHAHP